MPTNLLDYSEIGWNVGSDEAPLDGIYVVRSGNISYRHEIVLAEKVSCFTDRLINS